MRWISCAVLICSLVSADAAQQSAPKTAAKKEAPAGTLHSVTFKGNSVYAAKDIFKESGLKIGQRITGAEMEQARLKLQQTELFTNVSDSFHYSAGSPPAYDVTFEITENQQLFPMRFERLGVAPDAIRKYLQDHVDLYSDKIPGGEGVLKRYTEAVQQLIAQSNSSLKVKSAISNDDPKQLTVLFTPDAPAQTISQVFVTGNQAVDTGTILRAVNQVAIGVPLSDTRLAMILDGAIRPVYAKKGYVAVTFPKIETEPSKTNLGVIVKVEIKEGPVFKFGAIHFHGHGMDEDEIRSAITFKPGQTYDGDKADNFRLDMQHRLRRKGYLDTSITAESKPDDSKLIVDVTYNVVPGSVYNFDKLDIRGLDINTEPEVAKLWGEKPGKPFNPDYPDFFLKRVQQQGIFDNLANIESDYTADATSHNVTVHLYFKGGQSKGDKERTKKEEEEKRKSDGTWSPYPAVPLIASLDPVVRLALPR